MFLFLSGMNFGPVKEIYSTREELKQILENELIKEIVPEYYIKIIQKYTILDESPKEDEIYNTYIRLILDYRFGFEKPSKQKK